MLLIKTKISASAIHGIGLYADEFIPKGTIVWKLSPEFDRGFTEEEMKGMNRLNRNFLETYCFKYSGKYYLCVDDARFMNHSSDPNCTDLEENVVVDYDMGHTITIKDVQAGEELTCNYALFGNTEEDLKFNMEGVQ